MPTVCSAVFPAKSGEFDYSKTKILLFFITKHFVRQQNIFRINKCIFISLFILLFSSSKLTF